MDEPGAEGVLAGGMSVFRSGGVVVVVLEVVSEDVVAISKFKSDEVALVSDAAFAVIVVSLEFESEEEVAGAGASVEVEMVSAADIEELSPSTFQTSVSPTLSIVPLAV